MQSNKNIHYKSSYNTQPVTTQGKVGIVRGKLMPRSIVVQANDSNQVIGCRGNTRDSTFDFAGLAG
jgi:hypothetical protein